MVCFVFVACCWVSRATLVVLKDHPLYRQDLFVGVVCGGGVLCENCIVDANAIIINGNGNDYCCCCLFFFFVVFVLGIFCCLCVIICLCFLFLGRTVDALVC